MKAQALVVFCDCYADEFAAFMVTAEGRNNRLLFADKSISPLLQSKIDAFSQTCAQAGKRIQER